MLRESCLSLAFNQQPSKYRSNVMTQQAKKIDNHNQETPASATAKISETLRSAVEPIQKTQEKVLKMGTESLDRLMRRSEDFNRVGTECATICSENINACIESGNKALPILQNITGELMESCNRSFSELAEISKEASSCRTMKSMIELQNKTVRQVLGNYFDTTNKLCGMLFDSCSEAFEPINERTAVASEQFRKALAA
jgi:hypothetical protein